MVNTGYPKEKRVTIALLEFLEVRVQEGAMAGLQKRFEKQSLTDTFNSWTDIRKGRANMGFISLEQTKNIFTPDEIAQIAKEAVVTPDEAAYLIKMILPDVVSHITPAGGINGASEKVQAFTIRSYGQKLDNTIR